MAYRVHWRLLGRENRLLDCGEIDNGFTDRPAALQALAAFLRQFSVWGRYSDADGTWWARRSPDADLLVQIELSEEAAELELVPALWASRRSEGAPLRT